uniref:Ion-translocating oxidoreductase complex subunit G n=1 Tax=candidate division WOR-3 bacterium TaxID=2052148 RepID=A0A7C4GG34_UNCW3
MKESRVWMVASLVLTCAVAAFALSQVYAVTRPKIDYQRKVKAVQEALAAVMPAAASFHEQEPGEMWFALDAQGNRIGTVLKAAKQGYAGPVPVTVGIGLDGRIVAVRVASASEGLKETPGLGLKATEPSFLSGFVGKTAPEVRLTRDGGAIDAITGATITSRAVADGVSEAMERHLEEPAP